MTQVMRKNSRRLSAVCAVLAAFVMMLLGSIQAFAVTDYIDSWDHWKEAGKPSATWNDVADAMDQCFSAAASLYDSGDSTGAYNAINAGYYNYYSTKKWGKAETYSLCVDSTVLGRDGTVELLCQFVNDYEQRIQA